jgi:hypothetical protein
LPCVAKMAAATMFLMSIEFPCLGTGLLTLDILCP